MLLRSACLGLRYVRIEGTFLVRQGANVFLAAAGRNGRLHDIVGEGKAVENPAFVNKRVLVVEF